MKERLFATRETKIEYSCGCTTTRIEAIRLTSADVHVCEAHQAHVIREIEKTEYPRSTKIELLPADN
jgi:hypothetical protein